MHHTVQDDFRHGLAVRCPWAVAQHPHTSSARNIFIGASADPKFSKCSAAACASATRTRTSPTSLAQRSPPPSIAMTDMLSIYAAATRRSQPNPTLALRLSVTCLHVRLFDLVSPDVFPAACQHPWPSAQLGQLPKTKKKTLHLSLHARDTLPGCMQALSTDRIYFPFFDD
ncbi:hypothetical protein ACJQWK_03632 [Exserohilum turcicum]